ncbi:hypothetical protein NM952_10565 [Pasteurella multocida subsp. multocida]|uniref:DUF7210 domain-containing protein n=1 Tax=Pasteurella multocida TaxID=747 RepID=A0A9X3URS2_PASMD|nr:hypothetical protein [Pasteurella multocida]MBF6981390.1 hypothetical protein [Pasteurella multocida]MBF6985762.1 hypothetical protein [Pasteurella multocida]MDA5609220.1 hypothetical protein [Pasteurella multocida subsp. multocida]MDA5611517.1 hypothetical protein [Pasteurella multocida]MDA5613985.1 hypothetical protein [Pasteurella multocida]
MTKQEVIIAIVVGSALHHNGKHYAVGDEITVTPEEFSQLSIYLQSKDEALKAREQAEREAQATAATLASQADSEREALEKELEASREAHAKAEALAAENGLRAEQAAAKVAELEAVLADKETEIAKLSADLTACKKAEKGKTQKADSNNEPA